jgi:uncharacterized protein with HEPN domain
VIACIRCSRPTSSDPPSAFSDGAENPSCSHEILAAIDGIEHSVAGRTLDDFQQDWLLKHGIQRGIEIISEASRHLPDELRNTRPDIPWKQIAGIGSVLRHEYHSIADVVIWRVVTDYLRPLKDAVLAMQAELDE